MLLPKGLLRRRARFRARLDVARQALVIGLATGSYGISFGAIATTAGLTVAQVAALSLLMFTGASQLAFVGALGAGASPWNALGPTLLLGARNAFYGLRLSPMLGLKGLRRALGAQLVIDESTAMAVSHELDGLAVPAFWMTGASVFVLWNIASVAGALGARALPNPDAFGLGAAAPAAFVALLAPRLRGAEPWAVALAAAAAVVAVTPSLPTGLPVLVAGAMAVLVGLRPSRPGRRSRREEP